MTQSESIRPGSVIEFKDKKGILLAVCQRAEGSSVRILTEAGKEFSYPAEKIANVTSHLLDPGKSPPELKNQLETIRNRVAEMVGSIDLQDLWEFFAEATEDGVSLTEMSQTYFGDEENTDQRSAMLRALHYDALYFKRKGDLYVPKSQEAVLETRRQIEEQERKLQEKNTAVAWFRRARIGQAAERPGSLDRQIELLKGAAIFREEAPHYKEAAELLRDLGEEAPEGAFGLLVEIGEFDRDENLLLMREQVPTRFSSAAVEEARGFDVDALIQAAAEKGLGPLPVPGRDRQPDGSALRADLRSLEAFSIDDADTREIDDAISLEVIPEGFRLGVHIADVSEFVAPDSLLDAEAVRRATTIYLPDQILPMLPEAIAHEAASLRAGVDRLSLSLLAEFNSDLELVRYLFTPGVIQVRHGLTYEEAGARCQAGEEPMGTLLALCQKLREARVQRGARIFERAELKVRVSPDRSITIKRREGEGPGDIVISELMIFMNQLAGQFCADLGLPAVYRVQPPPNEEVSAGAAGPVSRRLLSLVKKIQVTTSPGPHWGLGLPAYAQMTSPIRRYLDLVVHRQIKAGIGFSGTPYDAARLLELIGATEAGTDAANTIQRWSNKYWLLECLSNRDGQTLPAMIQEIRDETYLVRLPEYLLDIPFYAPAGKKYQLGEELEVRIKAIDSRKGILKVQAAQRR